MKINPAQRLPCSHLPPTSRASLSTFPDLPNSGFPTGITSLHKVPFAHNPSYSPGVKNPSCEQE